MGKLKRKRAATVLAKKKQKLEGQELNPFEVRVNRKKHHVLGQRSNSDRGLPGVSRSKAILKVICAPVKTLLLNIHYFALFFFVCVWSFISTAQEDLVAGVQAAQQVKPVYRQEVWRVR